MPAQGDGSNGRNGDSIVSKRYKIRMLIANKGDRPNVTYRLVVFAARAGTSNTYGNVFENISGNVLLDSVNSDRCTINFN